MVRQSAILVLAFAFVSSGCYSTEQIKPSELPKLNGGTVGRVASGEDQGRMIAISVGHVEGIDGKMVEVNGKYSATVVERNGNETDFDHPVYAEIQDQTMTVRGGNRASTSFDLNNVNYVQTSAYDPAMTNVALGVGGAAVALIVVGIAFAAMPSVPSH